MAEGEQPDNAQKTEEPTPKKLEEARKKGQVAVSREINNWIMLLAATILIMTMSKHMLMEMSGYMASFISRSHDIPYAPGGVYVALGNVIADSAHLIAMPLFFLFIAAFLGPFLQIGPMISFETIKPDISKISPMKGLQRLFSKRAIMEFVKGILKISIIGVVGTIILYPYFDKTEHMIGLPVTVFMGELYTLTIKLMLGVLVVLAIVAAIDLVYQRFEHHQKMRMTKQEVKDEYKQTEGDPHIKARLRGLRAERARRRMMQNVPLADVVITNPTHYSIALKYKPDEMDAPVCVAKGTDELAMRIREVAREHDVVIYPNPPLARSLYDVVELDEMIPIDQYKAVAEVISYVFKTKGRG